MATNLEMKEQFSMDLLQFNQWDMSSLDELLTSTQIWADDNNYMQYSNQSPDSFASFTGSPAVDPSPPPPPPPPVAHKPKKSPIDPSKVPAPSILSFGSPNSPCDDAQLYSKIAGVVVEHCKKRQKAERRRGFDFDDALNNKAAKKSSSSSARQPCTKEHIIAKRKRRENISQKFMALSAIVPGLKKMDKASVLGDTIKYLTQLQVKVKTLKEQQSARKYVEPATLVKKSHNHRNDQISSCGENFGHNHTEIEVKISERTVLLNIHCKKQKGIMAKLLFELETLNLTVSNVGVVPFAGSMLDVTVMAQVEEGFSLSVKDVLKKLHLAFKRFMETT